MQRTQKAQKQLHICLRIVFTFLLMAVSIYGTTCVIKAAAPGECLVNSFDPDTFADWGLWCGDGSSETQQLVDGYIGKSLKTSYLRSAAGWGLVAHAFLPAGTDLTGTKTVEFMIKGDGTNKALSVGFESPGNKYRKIITITGNTWTKVIIPVNELGQVEGSAPLDWSKINGININPEENGEGSYTLDEFVFDKRAPNVINNFDPDKFSGWGLWCGDGSSETQQTVEGYSGQGLKTSYLRSAVGWGLVAHASLPAGTDLTGTKSVEFMIKGDGTNKVLSVGLEAPGNKYRKIIIVTGNAWTFVSITASELEQVEGSAPLDWSNINGINISPEENGEGSYTIDDFTFNKKDINVVNGFDPDKFSGWGLWCGDGSSETQQVVEGYVSKALKTSYIRSAAGWGLVAHASLPPSMDLTGTRALIFMIKGDGIQKKLSVGLESPGNKYRKIITVTGNSWVKVVIPAGELEQVEGSVPLDWSAINGINISPEENGEGSYTLDDFIFYKGGTLAPEKQQYSTPVILQNFNYDDSSNWEYIGDGGAGAKISAAVDDQGKSGKAIQFNYTINGWGCLATRSTGANSDWSKFTGVSFWVKGTPGQQFDFRFEEAPAPNDIWRKTVTIQSSGWEHVTINFSDLLEDENTDGNHLLDLGNIYKFGFSPVGVPGSQGSFSIDEIVLTSPVGGCAISNVRTTTLGSVFTGNPIILHIDMTNFGTQAERKTIGYTVKNLGGETVTAGRKEGIIIDGNLSGSDTISFSLDKYGYYTADLYFVDGDERQSLVSKAFVYIDPCNGNNVTRNAKTRLGFSTHYDFLATDEMRNNEADLIKLSGANLARNDFLWNIIEPAQGNFDWTLYDKIVNANYSRNIDSIGILCYTSSWGNTGPEGVEMREHYPPKFVSDYANYIYKTVARYKDKVHNWEIWNEPNLDGFFRPTASAKVYIQLLKAGYLAAKRADPEAKVVMGGLSGTGIQYITELLGLGAAAYMDALVIHPYQGGDPDAGAAFITDIISVRKLLANKDIWITEWGWRSDEQGLANQADYVIKGYLQARAAGVQNIALYSFNTATDTHFGIINSGVGGEVKPAYAAVNAMNKILGDRDYKGDLSLGETIKAYAFTKEGKLPILALWSTANKTVRIHSGANATLYDLYGNKKEISPSGGLLSIDLTNQPVYLTGAFDAIVSGAVPKFIKTTEPQPEPEKNWQMLNPYYQRDNTAITRGYAGHLEVEVYNYQDKPITGLLVLKNLPRDWFSKPSEALKPYMVKPFSSRVVSFELHPPQNTAIGTYTAKVVDQVPVNKLKEVEYPIDITPSVIVLVNKKAIILTNRTDSSLQGTVEFDNMAGWAINMGVNVFSLQAGGSISLIYNLVPQAQANINNGAIIVSGKVRIGNEVIPFSQRLFAAIAGQAITSMVIDGVKGSEWDGAEPVVLNDISQVSPEYKPTWNQNGLSGEFHTRWDLNNLYVLAVVKDDQQYQPQSGGAMWQGDSLQLAFDAGNIGNAGYGPNVYELQIGKPDNGDAQIFKGMGFAKSGLMQTAQIAVVRDETMKTTTYEMKIPFAELDGMPLIYSGKDIGYSILINDNDGGSRKGYMEWASGIGASKNAAQFGTLWLK